MDNFIIKQLTAEDWKIWKELRLEALKNSPESFGSSYEEEVNQPDLDFQNSLIKSDIFGVFVDNSLVSCAGFYSLNSAKTKHRGIIWGMYTRPEYRGQGIATIVYQKVADKLGLPIVDSTTKGFNQVKFRWQFSWYLYQ